MLTFRNITGGCQTIICSFLASPAFFLSIFTSEDVSEEVKAVQVSTIATKRYALLESRCYSR